MNQSKTYKALFRYITVKPLALVFLMGILLPNLGHAQKKTVQDSAFTLQRCIDYAMKNQPALNQALINIAIAHKTNDINLSGWLPQVTLSGTILHYYQLPTAFTANQITPGGPLVETHSGIANTAIPQVNISQTIFSPQVFYAANSAPLYIQQARQYSDSTKIDVVVEVSKSFYNLLLTLEQINVLKEDTARLGRNVKDTYHQFVGGIVDKTDYEEAVISLNTSNAQLRQQIENVVPSYALLKQLMGFPQEQQFNVTVDTTQMVQEINYDTTKALEYGKRIEYQELLTERKLQQQLTGYYRTASLPNIGAFYNYFDEFESNSSPTLYSSSYPYSDIGLTVSIPIFTGLNHYENIQKSKLQERLIDWDEVNLKSEIYTQYASALAAYKSNLYNWKIMKDNEVQAKDVYKIVSLQYRQGIVAYLNMIVAESNLISAEIGYTNALFQVLSSKIDLEKAIGEIKY